MNDGSGKTMAASAVLGSSAGVPVASPGAPAASPGAFGVAEALVRYQAIRGNVEHEDRLMGTRVGWLIASEAFLFVAYANVGRSDHLVGKAENMRWVLPVLGLVIAVLVLGAIAAAMRAICELNRQAEELKSQAIELFPLGLLPVVGERGTYWLGFLTTLGLPVALIVAWAYILLA